MEDNQIITHDGSVAVIRTAQQTAVVVSPASPRAAATTFFCFPSQSDILRFAQRCVIVRAGHVVVSAKAIFTARAESGSYRRSHQKLHVVNGNTKTEAHRGQLGEQIVQEGEGDEEEEETGGQGASEDDEMIQTDYPESISKAREKKKSMG